MVVIKSLLKYIIVAAFGTLLIGTFAPFWNSRQVLQGYRHAEALSKAGHNAQALDALQRIEPLASPFPVFAHRIDRLALMCHVRMADVAGATFRAVEIYRTPLPDPVQVVDPPFDIFEMPGLFLLSVTVMKPDPEFEADPWVGFELFVAEAKRRSDKGMLAHAAKAMFELDPQNQLAASIKRYLGRSYGKLAARKVPKSTSNRVRLARAYAGQKQWARALKEVDLALRETPGDSEAVRLRELILNHDARWGVVNSLTANCYNSAGVFLQRTLPPGTIVEIVATITAQNGSTLENCTVHFRGKQIAGVLLRTADVSMASGQLALVSSEERELRVNYGKTLAAIVKEKRNIKREAGARNPHSKAYSDARQRYVEFGKKVDVLKKKRDSTAGRSSHMKYADQLRRMKGDGIRLRQEYEATLAKYREWKRKNARSAPTTSARLRQLEGTRDGIAAKLARFNQQG